MKPIPECKTHGAMGIVYEEQPESSPHAFKARCKFCRKKCGVPMTCKHCSLDLCIGCYIPEVHMCKNYPFIFLREYLPVLILLF